MAKQFFYKMRNKKALSAVVTMVVILALVVAVVGVVFTLTKKTVEGEIEKSEACGLNLLDKFSINSEFVCYDKEKDWFVFSITRGDIDVDSLLVGIETETQIIQYGIRKGDNDLTNLISYPEKDKSTSLPLKKGGATYIATGIAEQVISVQIAPKINGEQCEVVATLNEITPCESTTILKDI